MSCKIPKKVVTWGGSIKKKKVGSTHLSRKILSLGSDKNGRFGEILCQPLP
jgi:hypothetical protein